MSPIALLSVVLFAGAGSYFGVQLVADSDRDHRAFHLSHLLMSVMMIMMAVGWSMRVPASLQIIVFTGFALWYVYLLMFRPVVVKNLTAGSPRHSHHAGRSQLIYHTAMMLAMVWMAVIMAPLPTADAGDHQSHSQHGHGASTSTMPVHEWADPVSIAIGVAFAGAALWYLVRFIRLAGAPRHRTPIAAHRLVGEAATAAMAAGMAIALIWEMT